MRSYYLAAGTTVVRVAEAVAAGTGAVATALVAVTGLVAEALLAFTGAGTCALYPTVWKPTALTPL